MKLKKLTEIMKISGVRVYAHWSVLLIGTLVLIGAFERPAETLAAWTAYFSVKMTTLPSPIEAKSLAMPGDDGLRFDKEQCRTPIVPQP